MIERFAVLYIECSPSGGNKLQTPLFHDESPWHSRRSALQAAMELAGRPGIRTAYVVELVASAETSVALKSAGGDNISFTGSDA